MTPLREQSRQQTKRAAVVEEMLRRAIKAVGFTDKFPPGRGRSWYLHAKGKPYSMGDNEDCSTTNWLGVRSMTVPLIFRFQ